MLCAFIRTGGGEALGTQPPAASAFSFWLIYNSYLISREKAALDAVHS